MKHWDVLANMVDNNLIIKHIRAKIDESASFDGEDICFSFDQGDYKISVDGHLMHNAKKRVKPVEDIDKMRGLFSQLSEIFGFEIHVSILIIFQMM